MKYSHLGECPARVSCLQQFQGRPCYPRAMRMNASPSFLRHAPVPHGFAFVNAPRQERIKVSDARLNRRCTRLQVGQVTNRWRMRVTERKQDAIASVYTFLQFVACVQVPLSIHIPNPVAVLARQFPRVSHCRVGVEGNGKVCEFLPSSKLDISAEAIMEQDFTTH